MGRWDMSRHKMDEAMLAPEQLLMMGSVDSGYICQRGCVVAISGGVRLTFHPSILSILPLPLLSPPPSILLPPLPTV